MNINSIFLVQSLIRHCHEARRHCKPRFIEKRVSTQEEGCGSIWIGYPTKEVYYECVHKAHNEDEKKYILVYNKYLFEMQDFSVNNYYYIFCIFYETLKLTCPTNCRLMLKRVFR